MGVSNSCIKYGGAKGNKRKVQLQFRQSHVSDIGYMFILIYTWYTHHTCEVLGELIVIQITIW